MYFLEAITLKIVTTDEKQPLILRGSHEDREARAQELVGLFVKFLSDNVDRLVQVRQDFVAKPATELIMGCSTWGEYCNNVLHYSEGHIRKLIAGRNPATAKHDGSKNRKAILEDSEWGPHYWVDDLNRPGGFVSRCGHDPVLRALVLEQARLGDLARVTENDAEAFEHLLGVAGLEGTIVNHIWDEAERRRMEDSGFRMTLVKE